MQNMKKKKRKKTIDNASFFTFFHNSGPNLAQILPQVHTHFFAGFQCYGIQLILITLIQ